MAANEPWREGRRRAMLTALADNPQPWRYTAKVGEGGDCTVGFVPRHGSSMLGAPPKPLGMITGRVGNGVHGLSASLLPRER